MNDTTISYFAYSGKNGQRSSPVATYKRSLKHEFGITTVNIDLNQRRLEQEIFQSAKLGQK